MRLDSELRLELRLIDGRDGAEREIDGRDGAERETDGRLGVELGLDV